VYVASNLYTALLLAQICAPLGALLPNAKCIYILSQGKKIARGILSQVVNFGREERTCSTKIFWPRAHTAQLQYNKYYCKKYARGMENHHKNVIFNWRLKYLSAPGDPDNFYSRRGQDNKHAMLQIGLR